MRARVFLPVLGVFALVLSGCSTPQSRISEQPALYQSLSARNQQLVAHGQIAPGMAPGAVYLAWGDPQQKTGGMIRNNTTETWIYLNTTSAPYGYGYGGFGGYGYGGFYGGFGGVYHNHGGRRFAFYGDPFYDPFFYPGFAATISYPTQTVTFVGGRVVSFQYFVAPYRY